MRTRASARATSDASGSFTPAARRSSSVMDITWNAWGLCSSICMACRTCGTLCRTCIERMHRGAQGELHMPATMLCGGVGRVGAMVRCMCAMHARNRLFQECVQNGSQLAEWWLR